MQRIHEEVNEKNRVVHFQYLETHVIITAISSIYGDVTWSLLNCLLPLP